MTTCQNVNLLLMLTCTLFAVVTANFTMETPLRSDDIACLEECQFLEDNQTIIIINITEPKLAVKGVAYYTTPIRMKDPATRTVTSFNTSFIFREEPKNYNASAYVTLDQMKNFALGDGFTFMMSSSSSWWGDAAGRLGIFASNPKPDNPKVVAVEFDSYANADTDRAMWVPDQKAKEKEHVGLDIATAISSCIASVQPLNISFWQRDVLHSWIEYDGRTNIFQVRVANTSSRPNAPLLNCTYDLYDAVDEKMWIGFSGSVGDSWAVYYIYNWTFTSFGISAEFSSGHGESNVNVGLILGYSGGSLLVVLIFLVMIYVCLFRRRKRGQNIEACDMEGLVEMMPSMPEFISYKHLSAATKQFSDESKLGQGGFGSVYRGVLPKTGAQVAVKKVSNDSRQGVREFLAEVQIISQLRHRNVVELMGFCRDRGKFLLVYELLPKGSLDQALFKPKSPKDDVLLWSQRWKIVSGTAAALHYLHEGWRQQVIHRDVKSSNIMLDDEYNAKLGDFGLARLVDHHKSAATTMVAGTFGYIAPEASTGGKFTDKTDVFAFGAVCLELACGRKAYDPDVGNFGDLILVDKVWRHVNEGDLLSVADPLLLHQFDVEQMYIVLKLGLLCSHPDPSSRPSMRQVEQVLAGDADVPKVPESKPSMGSDWPQFSIDDLLLSSRSGSTQNKRLASSTSMPSSSSLASSNTVAMYDFG